MLFQEKESILIPQKEPKSSSVPAIDNSLVIEDLAPVEALNLLQNKPPPEPPKVHLSRDEQLKQSQAMIPLQMRSSFLPSEAVPRDILAEQRKQKQMEWRKELEKQRLGDGGLLSNINYLEIKFLLLSRSIFGN